MTFAIEHCPPWDEWFHDAMDENEMRSIEARELQEEQENGRG